MQAGALVGHQVLLVETESQVSLDVERILEEHGATVLSAINLNQALRFAHYPELSAAVLEYRLGAADAEKICEALSQRQMPFIFLTGTPAEVLERWPGVPTVSKPATGPRIVGALK